MTNNNIYNIYIDGNCNDFLKIFRRRIFKIVKEREKCIHKKYVKVLRTNTYFVLKIIINNTITFMMK